MRRRRRINRALAVVAALLALNAVLLVAQPGLALPRNLASYLLGPNMVRAEVVLKEGNVLHDYRLDRGRIRSVSGASLMLAEADGTVVTIPVAPNAEVSLNGARVPLSALRRRMTALVIRNGEGPAIDIRASRR